MNIQTVAPRAKQPKIRPQILEKFDLEFLQRSIGRTVGVHMERATRACHATPKVLIEWRRSLGSQSLLAQLDKSPVAAALTTAGGIATWCSNRKRPFPDTGDMGAYMCVDHPTSNSRAPVAAATTTAAVSALLSACRLTTSACSDGAQNQALGQLSLANRFSGSFLSLQVPRLSPVLISLS